MDSESPCGGSCVSVTLQNGYLSSVKVYIGLRDVFEGAVLDDADGSLIGTVGKVVEGFLTHVVNFGIVLHQQAVSLARDHDAHIEFLQQLGRPHIVDNLSCYLHVRHFVSYLSRVFSCSEPAVEVPFIRRDVVQEKPTVHVRRSCDSKLRSGHGIICKGVCVHACLQLRKLCFL